ncbi:MAG: PilZ domain-containing protein [Nitrospirota bacterium]
MPLLNGLIALEVSCKAKMEKRIFIRINSDTPVSFVYDNTIYTGTVKNISQHGMFIETEISLTCSPDFKITEVRFPCGDSLLEVPVRIVRTTNMNGCLTGMGVEIITPSRMF